MDTLVAPATPAEAVPGTSKFMESITKDIASVGQPPPPAAIAPVTPAAQPAPAAPVVAPATTTTTPAAKPDAAAQPAPAAPAAPEDDLPEAFSNAKAENWKRARQVIAELKTEIKTKDTTYAKQSKEKDDELVKLRSKPQVDPEVQTQLEALKKKNEEYKKHIKQIDIERDEDFQAHFKPMFEEAITSAKDAAGEHGDKIVALIEAAPSKWRKKELDAVLAEMESESDKIGLRLAFSNYDKARSKRSAEIANHEINYEHMKAAHAKKAEQRERENSEVRQRNLDAATKKSEDIEAFKLIEGNAEHNAMVESNKAMLRKFMTHEGLSIEEYMDAPIQAAEAKRLKGIVDAITKERDDLKKAVAELQGANPAMRGGQPAANGTGTPVVNTPYGESKLMGVFREGLREAGF